MNGPGAGAPIAKPSRLGLEPAILLHAVWKSSQVQPGAGSLRPSEENSLRLYQIDITL